jgi:hypothetical protein
LDLPDFGGVPGNAHIFVAASVQILEGKSGHPLFGLGSQVVYGRIIGIEIHGFRGYWL